MQDRDERESPSGAMRGSGEGAGSAGLPYPRTDAEDTGLGDGGLERGGQRAAGADAADGVESDATSRSAAGSAPRGDGGDHGDRTDPLPSSDERAGTSRDDGTRGADREHGGWGDRGIGGGRAGGTGI